MASVAAAPRGGAADLGALRGASITVALWGKVADFGAPREAAAICQLSRGVRRAAHTGRRWARWRDAHGLADAVRWGLPSTLRLHQIVPYSATFALEGATLAAICECGDPLVLRWALGGLGVRAGDLADQIDDMLAAARESPPTLEEIRRLMAPLISAKHVRALLCLAHDADDARLAAWAHSWLCDVSPGERTNTGHIGDAVAFGRAKVLDALWGAAPAELTDDPETREWLWRQPRGGVDVAAWLLANLGAPSPGVIRYLPDGALPSLLAACDPDERPGLAGLLVACSLGRGHGRSLVVSGLLAACGHGRERAARWLAACSIGEKLRAAEWHQAFCAACSAGALGLVVWLAGAMAPLSPTHKDGRRRPYWGNWRLPAHSHREDARTSGIVEAGAGGHVGVIAWFLGLGWEDAALKRIDCAAALLEACARGHVEAVRLLLPAAGPLDEGQHEWIWRAACESEHEATIREVAAHVPMRDALVLFLAARSPALAWMLRGLDFECRADDLPEALCEAVIQGNAPALSWILGTFVDPAANPKAAKACASMLAIAAEYGHIRAAARYCETYGSPGLAGIDAAKLGAAEHRHVEMADWLARRFPSPAAEPPASEQLPE